MASGVLAWNTCLYTNTFNLNHRFLQTKRGKLAWLSHWRICTFHWQSKTYSFTYRSSGASVSGCEEPTCRHSGEPSTGSCSPAERQGGCREKPQYLRHPPRAACPVQTPKHCTFLFSSLSWASLCRTVKCYWIRATAWNVNGTMMSRPERLPLQTPARKCWERNEVSLSSNHHRFFRLENVTFIEWNMFY